MTFVLIILGVVVPFIPLQFVQSEDIKNIKIDKEIPVEDIYSILVAARGGKFISIFDIFRGTVKTPFDTISILKPNQMYDVPKGAQITVGASNMGNFYIGGYEKDWMVLAYLKKEDNKWKLISFTQWLIN